MEERGASVEFEGELAKKGAGLLDRYFVLTDEGVLYWHKNQEDYKKGVEPQGSLEVNKIIRIGEKDEPGYFDLITPGRSYQLHASSSGTYYDLWIEALRRVMESKPAPVPAPNTNAHFRKKYTVSEIDAGRRKAERTLVFDEVDGVTNMQALARWRFAPEKIKAITRAPSGANPNRFTLSVVQEFTFEAKSAAQLAEIEKAVSHLLSVVGDIQPEEPAFQPSNVSASASSIAQENAMAQEIGAMGEDEACRETLDIGHTSAPPAEAKRYEGVSLEDFDIIRIIGKGGQGQVAQVRHHRSGKMYAMKSCAVGDKLKSDDGLRRVIAEKEVLQRIRHPFLVHLHYAFHKGHKIYLCLDLCHGGELYFHLKRFHPVVAGFYIGEVVAAIAYLHSQDIIYRDMKPENILVCDDGHLKLTDFGLAKMGITAMYGGDGGDVTKSLVGTPEYLAPEILSNQPYGKAADWWTVGILMFEVMVGKTPFIAQGINRAEMFRRIQSGRFDFPSSVQLPGEARDLVTSLVVSDPAKRLGTSNPQDIKDHPFFTKFLKVSFNDLEAKKVIPPWRPQNIEISNNVASSVKADATDFSSDAGGELSADEEARLHTQSTQGARFTFVSETPEHDNI